MRGIISILDSRVRSPELRLSKARGIAPTSHMLPRQRRIKPQIKCLSLALPPSVSGAPGCTGSPNATIRTGDGIAAKTTAAVVRAGHTVLARFTSPVPIAEWLRRCFRGNSGRCFRGNSGGCFRE